MTVSRLVSVRTSFALVALCLGSLLPAQGGAAAERYIVHLRSRSFDLQGLRDAIHRQRPAADVAAILADYERRTRADQEPIARAVQALGGRVVAQWWIVNACAVEVPHGTAGQLLALPNVLRLERDGTSRAGADRALDRYNHNTEALHRAGLTGAGVTVAIVDSGQDDQMGSSGRPHRVYFPGGDPAMATGSGIAGSRLLFNRQHGAMPAGAVAWHGMSVAAIAAGGDWGTPGGSPGHAFGADIAAYSIADRPDTTSLFSTQVSAWQQVLADRAAHNIAVANFSYHGQPDPTAAVQQAIDVAASVGDILVATIAGNFGNGGTTNSNGATNVLAAAAARPDAHDVFDYSSRGPLSGDPLRTFPDLAAVVHNYVPVADCEAGDGVFSGTSNAAPQVSGVAAVLRAAHPSLTALQTRALLLASTLDLSQRVPWQGPNDRGVGLLRADTAEQAAAAGTLTSARVTPSSPAFTWSLPVVQGREYAVALAWNRGDPTSRSWANLDLDVFDGAAVVGSSTSMRNTYEVVRFVATATGTWQARVRSVLLPQGPQDFALALAEQPVLAPRAGLLEGFGSGCPGTAGLGSQIVSGVNANLGGDHLLAGEDWGNYDLAIQVPVSAGQIVHGFEVLLAADNPGTVQTELLGVGAGGMPSGPPLATGTMDLGRMPAWYRTTFAAVPLPGPTVYVALRFSHSTRMRTWLASSTATQVAWRDACSGSWQTPVSSAVGARLLGPGALGDTPLLTASPRPTLGANWTLELQRALPNAAVFLTLGRSDQSHNGTPLPYDLGSLGAPTCKILAAPESVVGGLSSAGGTWSLAIPVPAGGAFLGMDLFGQALVHDPGANTLGAALSQGLRARLGSP